MSEGTKTVEVAKATGPAVGVISQETGRSQRATRHKKINFIEMLRGDSVGGADDESADSSDKKHKQKNNFESMESKKKKKIEERKVKVVHYSIETDSSEETDSVESDYSSSYDTDSTSESDAVVVKKPPVKQRKISPAVTVQKTNARSKVKVLPAVKPIAKDSLKVKITTNRSRSLATSTPLAVPVAGKSKSCGFNPPNTSPILSAPSVNKQKPLVFGKKLTGKAAGNSVNNDQVSLARSESKSEQSVSDISAQIDKMDSDLINSGIFTKPSLDMAETDLKVSPTLPDEILETPKNTELADEELPSDRTLNSSEDNVCITGMETEAQNSECVSVQGPKSSITEDTELMGTDSVPGKQVLSRNSDSPITLIKRKESVHVSSDELPLRIIHRDASPQTEPRNRSQLGEVFVERYHNKKSVCVRCYTCRKLMTVDSFLRHLHDVVSGGLIALTSPRTVDITDSDLTDRERKSWESFLRKKELFDNNQIPSPELVAESLVYSMDSEDSNQSTSEAVSPGEGEKKPSRPRIIKTPVSPGKKGKNVRKNDSKAVLNKAKVTGVGNKPLSKPLPVDTAEGVRSSSRKRKVKQLYPFEEYSFAKFPRLMKNADVNHEN